MIEGIWMSSSDIRVEEFVSNQDDAMKLIGCWCNWIMNFRKLFWVWLRELLAYSYILCHFIQAQCIRWVILLKRNFLPPNIAGVDFTASIEYSALTAPAFRDANSEDEKLWDVDVAENIFDTYIPKLSGMEIAKESAPVILILNVKPVVLSIVSGKIAVIVG